MKENTSSNSRESDTSSESKTDSTHSSSYSSHSSDEIENSSSRDVESNTQTKEESVAHKNKTKNKKDTKRNDQNKKKNKKLILGLSIGIPLLVIIVVIVVCCTLLIKKKKNIDAPNVTASVNMNGETRELNRGDVINKPPTFKLSDSDNSKEDTSCSIESKATCDKKESEWEEGLNPSTRNNLKGDCEFEFRRVCKRSVSDVTTFNLMIDKGLPDIALPVESQLTANKWIKLSFEASDSSDTNEFEWTVEKKKAIIKRTAEEGDDDDDLIRIDKDGKRFAVGGSGDFIITVTTTNNHSNIQEISINPTTPLKSTESTFTIPEDFVIISDDLLSDMTKENSVTEITLGSSVVEVEPGTLSWSSLECIKVDEKSSSFVSVDCVLFTKNMKDIVAYPPAKDGESYEISDKTEIILSKAFTKTSLSSITLPSGLKTIGEGAFIESSITSLTLPDKIVDITLTTNVGFLITGIQTKSNPRTNR